MQIYDKRSYNAIFFQPTTKCNWSCQGCYLKKYEKQNKTKDTDIPEWMAEVVSRVLDRKDIRANQITISLNHPWGVYQKEDVRNHALTKFLVKVINNIQRRGGDLETEVHFTVADMSIETYKAWGLWDPITSVADSVSISVDEFKTDLEACYKDKDFRLCKFNCNLQMTPGVVKQFKDPEAQIRQLLHWYDTIYMIAHKPILDGEYSKLHTESIRKTVEIYNKLPRELKKNVFIDKCVEACAKNEYTCEAGTNMMTVWPDGRIIGCPYATHGGTYAHPTADSVIKSMVAMRGYADGNDGKRHYFNRCKMRTLWKDIRK